MRDVRLQKLREAVLRNGSVEVDTMAGELDVSRETIRRDLAFLASQGLVHRSRGGATAPGGSLTELDLSVRSVEHHAEKVEIARYIATELVEDGMSIALDIGTTATEIARALRGRPITVVTPSLAAVSELAGAETRVVVLGGALRERSMSTVGPVTVRMAREFQCDLALICAPAINLSFGLMDTDLETVAIKQALIEHSTHAYAALDHTKLDRTAFVTVCATDRLQGLITDSGASADIIVEYLKSGLDVLQPDSQI